MAQCLFWKLKHGIGPFGSAWLCCYDLLYTLATFVPGLHQNSKKLSKDISFFVYVYLVCLKLLQFFSRYALLGKNIYMCYKIWFYIISSEANPNLYISLVTSPIQRNDKCKFSYAYIQSRNNSFRFCNWFELYFWVVGILLTSTTLCTRK